jgi:hypothetical protein
VTPQGGREVWQHQNVRIFIHGGLSEAKNCKRDCISAHADTTEPFCISNKKSVPPIMVQSFRAVVACLILIQCGVEGSPIPDTNTTAVDVSGEGVCSNKALLESLRVIVSESEPGIRRLGDIPAYAAASCQQIASLRPEASSGHYWIQEESGPTRVYCVMEGVSCGEGVWMEVANVNMTETSSRCPAGLEKVTSPKSLCRKTVSAGCSSASFSTHGVPFSKVCGRVIGYQYSTPDAFHPYYANQGRTIDDLYVDGVSITHSRVPRQHIWTLAAALDEVPEHNEYACPCTNSKSHVAFTALLEK